MNYDLVDTITVTVPSYSENEYTFRIQLSPFEIERLSYYKILGVRIQKDKYGFLNSVAERLQEEILKRLMEMES